MIAIEGRLNLKLSGYDSTIIEASTTIPSASSSTDLSGIINTINGTRYLTNVFANSKGKFVDNYKSASVTRQIVGDRMSFKFGGVTQYNGESCYQVLVGYENSIYKYLESPDNAVANQITVVARAGTYYTATGNYIPDEKEFGISVVVYIPKTLVQKEGGDIPDYLPTSVSATITITREEKQVGRPIEFDIVTDYAINELQFNFSNAYAPTINVNGVDYEVKKQVADDAQSVAYYYAKVNSSQTHHIVFKEWSIPNTPFEINGIKTQVYVRPEISRRSIVKFNCDIFDRDGAQNLSYGVISSRGSLQFNDHDGIYRALAERLALDSNIIFEAFLVNTLSKKREQVAYMRCAEWNYDNDNRVVSVSLADDLEEWQNIHIDGFDYDPRNPAKVLPNKTMADLYKWLHGVTPRRYFMLSFDELDPTTQNILNNTTIPYPFLSADNLWAQWNKLCNACALHIYKNSRGYTVCEYTDGV